jgi:hypothetical protein
MSTDYDDDLDPELQAALRRDLTPSDLLEERVVRALKGWGILHPPRALRRSGTTAGRLARIAAVLLLFLSGLAVGHWTAKRPEGRAIRTSRAPVRQVSSQSPRQVFWF